MDLIEGITDEPKQQMTLILADGTQAVLYLEFRLNQAGWFYDLTYGVFASKGNRLVVSPNLLRQYRDVIPFGLCLATSNGLEPTGQENFAGGTASLYLLNADDVAAIEAQFYPGL